jgi:hypothetical protein
VIGERHSKGRDAGAAQYAAKPNMLLRLSVPVRQHDDGASASALNFVRRLARRSALSRRDRKVTAVSGVVLLIRGADGACEPEQVAFERIIPHRGRGKELVRVGYNPIVELGDYRAGVARLAIVMSSDSGGLI